MRYSLVTLAVVIAFARLTGFRGEAYQALAHAFVGAMIGCAALLGWRAGRFYLWVVVALSVVEVIAFFTLR